MKMQKGDLLLDLPLALFLFGTLFGMFFLIHFSVEAANDDDVSLASLAAKLSPSFAFSFFLP